MKTSPRAATRKPSLSGFFMISVVLTRKSIDTALTLSPSEGVSVPCVAVVPDESNSLGRNGRVEIGCS